MCLRAGWAIGKTLESYLRTAKAGDQFCGRVVCGLPVLSHEFAMLPPHFKALGPDDRRMMMAALEAAYPFHACWGSTFQPVATFMLASLVKHQSWIKKKLPAEHPVMSKTLFKLGELEDLEECLTTGEETGMRPTGVPPHTMLFGQVYRLTELVKQMMIEMRALPGQFRSIVESCLHKRDTDNGTASMSVMLKMFDGFQNKMKDEWNRMFAIMTQQQQQPRPVVNLATDAAEPAAAMRLFTSAVAGSGCGATTLLRTSKKSISS